MKCIRKLLSIALALVMVQAILTSTASAAPYSVVHPKEGDYYIICSNGGYALDVTGGGDAAQCTPIQLYETNQTDAQIWKLVHVDGDWYLIVHKRTGMVLNVQHGDARQDGRLWLYPNDGTGACYWRFIAAGNQYLIQNQLGEQFVLDLHDNVSYNGALVHLWDKHDGPSARWQLVSVYSSNAYPVVRPEEGDYYIIRSNGGYALDVTGGGDAAQCTPIQLYETNQTDAQIWKLVHVDGDWYLIVHKRTGMVLNVQHGDARRDGRLWLYPNDGTGACYWRFIAAGNQYLIQNQLGEQFVLDLHDNVSYNGALVHLWDKHDGPSARWQLALISSSVVTHGSYDVSILPKSKENQPHYTNAAGQRSADALNTVLDQFEVATNKRHQKDSNGTYCNIFTWDATSALGCEIPHWTLNNAPVSSNTRGARELSANATCDWLNSYGGQYGWHKVSAYEAQQRANSGYPTVATWKNPNGGSGHVAMVRPESGDYRYSSSKGPVIAQAGAANYNYANVSTGFGSSMSAVVYWTHE